MRKDEKLLREALGALQGLKTVVERYGIQLPEPLGYSLSQRASEEVHLALWTSDTAITKLEERLK